MQTDMSYVAVSSHAVMMLCHMAVKVHTAYVLSHFSLSRNEAINSSGHNPNAQLGCDHGLNQRVPLRGQSVPVVGGVNNLVDTAM